MGHTDIGNQTDKQSVNEVAGHVTAVSKKVVILEPKGTVGFKKHTQFVTISIDFA